MSHRTVYTTSPENPQRRKAIQSVAAACVVVAAPALSADALSSNKVSNLSGKLVCNISNPVKTLLIRNHSDKTVVLDHMSNGALMFDGSIVDCNNAFLDQAVSIPANDEVVIRFSKVHKRATAYSMKDIQRIQSRVERLADGTRVIPFSAELNGSEVIFA